jgi:hypothetical protein
VSEQEIREGMLLAVWDEPPLDFDPDKLIRRVEQKKSRRRALVAVGVATAMIAVVSLSLPGLLPRDRNEQFASEGQVTTTAPPSESAERRVRRIGDAIASRLDEVTGDVKDIYGDLRVGRYPYSGYPSTPATTSTPNQPGGVEISGFILFTDRIGPTALRVEAGDSGFSKSSFCSGATTCNELSQDDGTVVHQAVFNDGNPDVSRVQVARVFRSGYVVCISGHNYNPASGAGLRQTVPLPVGVLTTLVTDPVVPWQ